MVVFTKSKLKQESIGQCVVKLASPLNIPPIPFARCVEVYHLYGSKWLNEELFRLGFSVSYGEVTRFKQASLVNQSLDEQIRSLSSGDRFTQFFADNVDHNIGTFHGMGIIAATVNNRANVIKEIKLKRPDKLLKTDELLLKATDVPITAYDSPLKQNYPLNKIDDILFKPRKELLNPYVLPHSLNADFLWNAAGLFSTKDNPRPNWSGYMQQAIHSEHPKNASITLLPIIDLNPTNYTCIYSTLLFVIDQCKRLNIPTPSITFDQPLWLKATYISVEKSLNIVIHLGGFHTFATFATFATENATIG